MIVKPPVALSTGEAYRELDEHERPQRPRNGSASIAMLEALQRGDFPTVEAMLQNDFHEITAARAPQIAGAIEALRAAGASNALLAGSGSCVFTLAKGDDTLRAIAQRVRLPQTFARIYALRSDTGVAMNAVVLAGGPLDDVAKLQPGAPNKAFVDICGTTLVGRVVEALRDCPSIGRIAVVTPPAEWGNPDLRAADDFRPDGVRIATACATGSRASPPTKPCSSPLPICRF